ncbi:extracellular solute-binding protein [Microbacterium sp.]|uniref:sugar ABC transporter substrate-binding protein n=1 Tax=Microbacterium sp. TaxID=51671 RepID=UPI0009292971|nr:extracellular solute-binding protein [Microbacterium sp.]MBN9180434.1 extracellular solute-binding protein [Microbacterium sp.]MBN9194142.1 extracellular solute-binding protein [Microbacterium sp.]OJU68701.1 MAG: ABC transporter substrate-binding protein [Microbacterium sp. 70-38]
MESTRKARVAGAALAALGVTAVVLTGCSGSGGGTSSSNGSGGGTYTLWDPYPDRDATSTWAKAIDACASDIGITIKRNAGNTGDTVKDLTTAAPNLPDIAMVDNPKVSTLADAGLLTTTKENGLDVSDIQANILTAGQIDGKTYGVPVGANTLGLYYNPTVLSAAGVDISSVKDWDSLTAALKKVVAAGKKGITFSAVGTEEGSFQFLPWFWGAGADLTKLDSDKAVQALTLWTDWVKQGLAPNSVLQNTQGTSWDEFKTGQFAFAENGSWFKGDADKAGYKVLQLFGPDGSAAPAPTGGEFITIPVQKDTARYATSVKIVKCLTKGDAGANALGYIAPTKAGQDAQLKEDPTLQFWVTAVAAAKPRTADNLGIKYGTISEQLYTAVQNALSGASTPTDALKKAQTDAQAALSK